MVSHAQVAQSPIFQAAQQQAAELREALAARQRERHDLDLQLADAQHRMHVQDRQVLAPDWMMMMMMYKSSSQVLTDCGESLAGLPRAPRHGLFIVYQGNGLPMPLLGTGAMSGSLSCVNALLKISTW